jgi:hypothetical protein
MQPSSQAKFVFDFSGTHLSLQGRRGRDPMVFGFTTTNAISCEFEFCSGEV